jgi:magnesium transporter
LVGEVHLNEMLGALMDPWVLLFRAETTVREALKRIRALDRRRMRMLFTVDSANRLVGLVIAVVTSLMVWIWSQSVGLTLAIGISMVLSMVIAGIFGAAIPLVLTAVGQDLAQSSPIVLTPVTDMMGFFSFLGIATLFSSML